MTDKRYVLGLVVFLAAVALSLSTGTPQIMAERNAQARTQRAEAWVKLGNPTRAEAELYQSLESNFDESPAAPPHTKAMQMPARAMLGKLAHDRGNLWMAEFHYRTALPWHSAAANLAVILNQSGRAEESVEILSSAIGGALSNRRPETARIGYGCVTTVGCWANLALAHKRLGHDMEAWKTITLARSWVEDLDPAVVEYLRPTLVIRE